MPRKAVLDTQLALATPLQPIRVAHNVHRVAHPAPLHSRQSTSNHPDINRLTRPPKLARRVQFPECLRPRGEDRSAILTTLFGTDPVPTAAAIPAPGAAKKRSWLPLLTVLFLISYGLMTMLIVEQGRTIESQRALIRELFRDSTELSAVRMKAEQERAQSSSPKAQAPVTQNPSSQTPPYPSTQARSSQAPSSQARPQHRAQNQAAKQKPEFQMPSKPAADLVDDVRTLITI